MPEFDAIILAGGRGSRLGGVSKADLTVGGRRLLDVVLEAVRCARTTVVVGQVAAPDGVLVTLEDPPGTGPAAGIVAGLEAVAQPAGWTVVLACDLPGVQAAVPRLLAATARDDDLDGYCLASPEGSPQWLLGIHRTPRLRLVAQTYGDPRNRSVRGLLAGLRLGLLPDADDDGRDVDTWVDHAYWNECWREKMSQDETGWQEFVDRVCAALEVDPGRVDMHGVLDLSREVAHAGARPMAPVSAHLWGLAAGADPGADLDYLRRVVEDSATSAPLPDAAVVDEDRPVVGAVFCCG